MKMQNLNFKNYGYEKDNPLFLLAAYGLLQSAIQLRTQHGWRLRDDQSNHQQR